MMNTMLSLTKRQNCFNRTYVFAVDIRDLVFIWKTAVHHTSNYCSVFHYVSRIFLSSFLSQR